MKYYLAYGSNLNTEQMTWRCPGAKPVGTAVIKGYELLFKGSKTGSYLTIEKKPDGVVPVAVWAVNGEHEKALDRYEGYPNFYYKANADIEMTTLKGDKKRITAFVYIMHEDRPLGIPSGRYMQTCLEGYRAFGFDEKYLFNAYRKSKGDSDEN